MVNCPDPLDCATWIEAYEREVVGKLAGNEPIAPGVTLSARESVAERDSARSYIFDELVKYGLTAQLHNYGTGTNAYAVLPATTSPSTVVVMGAHFDGIAGTPAAGDNGTGVALVLAAARYFNGLSERGDTLIFAFFDEEEVGLVGSQAFSDMLRLDGTVVSAMHNFDLISYDDDQDGAVELWSPAPALQTLYENTAADFGIPVRVVTFGSSDHASFSGDGIDSVGVSEEFVSGDASPYYHTPDDTFDKINFTYMLSITRLVFEAVTRSMD